MPQRLKPLLFRAPYRSAEALRHPKARIFEARFPIWSPWPQGALPARNLVTLYLPETFGDRHHPDQ